MTQPQVDLQDPKMRAIYRKAYMKAYADTAGEKKEYIRKDKASWVAFRACYKAAGNP